MRKFSIVIALMLAMLACNLTPGAQATETSVPQTQTLAFTATQSTNTLAPTATEILPSATPTVEDLCHKSFVQLEVNSAEYSKMQSVLVVVYVAADKFGKCQAMILPKGLANSDWESDYQEQIAYVFEKIIAKNDVKTVFTYAYSTACTKPGLVGCYTWTQEWKGGKAKVLAIGINLSNAEAEKIYSANPMPTAAPTTNTFYYVEECEIGAIQASLDKIMDGEFIVTGAKILLGYCGVSFTLVNDMSYTTWQSIQADVFASVPGGVKKGNMYLIVGNRNNWTSVVLEELKGKSLIIGGSFNFDHSFVIPNYVALRTILDGTPTAATYQTAIPTITATPSKTPTP